MNVSVLQDNLKKALQSVTRIVDNRPTLPVLANVSLTTDAAAGRMTVAATNLEVSTVTWVGAKVHTDGAITLPAKTLSELVNTLSPERVDLTLDDATQTMSVVCGATHANVKGLPADEFPAIPTGNPADVVVDAQAFKEAVQHVEFAAAKDESRPILTGIYMSIEGDTMTLATADGYRLAVRTVTLDKGTTDQHVMVVPARALSMVAKLIETHDATVGIALPRERDTITFQLPHSEVSSMVLDGRYPDFMAIVPSSHDTVLRINTRDLLVAAKRAEIFARDNANNMRMVVSPPTQAGYGGEVVLVGRSAERGDNEMRLQGAIEGAYVEASYNVKYLMDALSAIKEDDVMLEFNGEKAPLTMRPFGRSDFVQVIMPMSNNR